VAGFSLGAQVAAILAGDDPRVRAADVIAGRGTDVTLFWVRRAKARLFFQAGTHDPVVPHVELVALMDAAPGRPRVRWYAAGHELTPAIDRDLTDWMIHTLG
jgi:predicted esterase